MKDKYIRMITTSYALPRLLLYLHQNKIKHITITMEDNEIMVVLWEEELNHVVYKEPYKCDENEGVVSEEIEVEENE